MCAHFCTWLVLFNLFSVGGATSHHGSMFPDHSIIKWFDAVSSRFKTEANATIFGSFHHVAAHMYDMHHRMAHSPAVDDEFSDAFFHIATLPRIAPNFGASPSFFVDYELPKALMAVSAVCRNRTTHTGFRIGTDAQEINCLTPFSAYEQIYKKGANSEIFGEYGQHPGGDIMPGGRADSANTADQHEVLPCVAPPLCCVCF